MSVSRTKLDSQRGKDAVPRLLRRAATVFLLLVASPLCCGTASPQESAAPAASAADDPLATIAESSGWTATCTTAQCDELVNRIAAAAPAGRIQVVEFGRTFKGHPLKAMVISNSLPEIWPARLPESDPRLPVVVFANIHSGECDGKEALLMLARDLARAADHPWLERLVLVLVPNYNADANDMMAPDNRPGQDGPAAGMGRRENAQDLDLNRDFVKLDAPETRSLVRLVDQFDPAIIIDCHTTDGSRHRYQLTYDIPHNPASPLPIRTFLRNQFMPAVTRRMQEGGRDAWYYGNFDRGRTRWDSYGYEPRYSTEYFGLRGRLGILSESYAYISYRERIEATRAFVTSCLDQATEEADRIRELIRTVDQQWMEQLSVAPERFDLPVEAQAAAFPDKHIIPGFQGTTSEPEDCEVEYWGNYIPATSVVLPWAYALPPEPETVLPVLRSHGLQIERLSAAVNVEAGFQTVQEVRRSPRAWQGRSMVRIQTNSGRGTRRIPAGWLVVRTAQPLGRLAVWLLEPQSVDGLAAWGFFEAASNPGIEFPVLRIERETAISTEPLAALPEAGASEGK